MAKVNNNDVWIYILRLREGRCKFRDSHSNLSELAEGLGFLWLHPLCLAVIPRLVFTNDVLVTASWRRRPCCSNECTRCRMSTSPCIVRTVTSSRREAVGRRREVLRSWQAVNVSDASECFVSHMINCRFVGSGRGVRVGVDACRLWFAVPAKLCSALKFIIGRSKPTSCVGRSRFFLAGEA